MLDLVWLPTQVIVGFCVSLTVTVKLQLALLPAASITFHITVVMPLLNTTPARVVLPVPVVAPVKVYTVEVIAQLSPLAVGLNSVSTVV